jgi:branched-chain amino acid transport system ATP-binding protein
LLEARDLTVYYDGALALNNVSLTVEDGKFISVVGPNGAGKTTILRTISGLEEPDSGTITFDGERIDKLPAYKIVKKGVVHCPERRRLFPEMSVLENLKIGAYLRKDRGVAKDMETCFQLFPVLKERLDQQSRTLSGGEQQMLAIARALMSKPKLLLIDEPSLGLAPMLKNRMFDTIKKIQLSGVTVLLVEQDVSVALDISDRIYVIAHGRIITEGTREQLMKNRDVREIYLGI